MKNKIISVIIFAGIIVTNVLSQDDESRYGDIKYEKISTEGGLVFTMAESGSGGGIFFALPFGSLFHAGIAADAFFIRDSKQIEYVDPYYGGVYQMNKINNVYIFDVQVTIKRRLFAEDLDDSFRPFLSGGFGPVFGMNFPEDTNLRDQYEWSFGGFVGGGVDITFDKKYFFGVRGQYRFIPFSRRLGETKNHTMFELRFEIGRRF
jgi:hypothetical protein